LVVIAKDAGKKLGSNFFLIEYLFRYLTSVRTFSVKVFFEILSRISMT